MKKTLILYVSNTGDTKRYAEDIAHAVEADVMPLKKCKWRKIDDYDIVIFAGWIMGGNIKGLNDFLAHWDNELDGKDVIVIGVGMGFASSESRKVLINQNLLDMFHLRFYQFQGNFDMNRLSKIYQLMMKASITKIASDPNATEGEKSITTILENPIECYDTAKVQRVIEVVRQLQVTPEA